MTHDEPPEKPVSPALDVARPDVAARPSSAPARDLRQVLGGALLGLAAGLSMLLGADLYQGLTAGKGVLAADVAAIEALQNERVRAFNAQDIAASTRLYTPDNAHVFHVIPPWSYDLPALADDFRVLYGKFDVPPVMKLTDLHVERGSGDLAYARAVLLLTGTKRSGLVVDMEMRVTDVLRKVGDRWLIEHEHMSVPVDPESKRGFMNSRESPGP